MEHVVLGAVVPHPPIIIPEIGGQEAQLLAATAQSIEQLAKDIRAAGVDTVVIISPHGPVFEDGLAINGSASLAGSFGQFGQEQLRLMASADLPLAEEIAQQANSEGIATVILNEEGARDFEVSLELDHGVLVPWYFLHKQLSQPLVSITMGLLPYEDLYRFGQSIARAAAKLKRRIAVIASGDLSHRLASDGPYGYHPQGPEFDAQVVKAMEQNQVEALFKISAKCISDAGECGLRPIIMMLGCLDGYRWQGQVYSYEGPFGVGYMVAKATPIERIPSLVEKLYAQRRTQLDKLKAGESPLVQLARQALEAYVQQDTKISAPQELTPELAQQAGVFVSIKQHGNLRGCIGTIAPTQPNVAEEIINNAIQAGTQDPRFFPVEEDELETLTYSVDVLLPPEPISSSADLDVEKYGVIVRRGARTGLLLPNLEGVNSPAEQIAIAKQKAGIAPEEDCTMERFEVVRYS